MSLLPSATEIVCALGLSDRLIGVTHECDYPEEIRSRPHVTSSLIDADTLSGGDIDRAVRDSLADQETIYGLDSNLLADLQPDLILTQELCDVCAVGPPLVQRAVAELPHQPQVVSLEPRTLAEVFESIRLIGDLTGADVQARGLVDRLNGRLNRIRSSLMGRPRVRVLTMEWIDPLFVGGHWVPEMVYLAGGLDVLGHQGEPSREASWQEAVEREPQVIVAMPCGFGLERSLRELTAATMPAEWQNLPAVWSGEVYAVDGSAYFSRPGPRLVDGVEILANIFHPDIWESAPRGSVARVPEAARS